MGRAETRSRDLKFLMFDVQSLRSALLKGVGLKTPVSIRHCSRNRCRQRSFLRVQNAAIVQQTAKEITEGGHYALVQGLGQLGEINTSHLPWILRLAHIRFQ